MPAAAGPACRPRNLDRIFQRATFDLHGNKEPGGQRRLGFIGFAHTDDDIDHARALIEFACRANHPARPIGFSAGNAGADADRGSRLVTRGEPGYVKPVKILVLKGHHNLSLVN